MTTYTPPPEPGRTAARRSRPVPLVIGILLAVVGFPLLLGGLGLGWAMATQRDDDGFFTTPTEQLDHRDGGALQRGREPRRGRPRRLVGRP